MKRLGGHSAFRWVFGIPDLAKHGKIGVAVDLGSGSNPRNVFDAKHIIGIDVFEMPPFPVTPHISYLQLDRSGRLPIDDSSVDVITAFDVLEHIPRQSSNSEKNPFIETMNEIHRVLKPGGSFLR